MLVQLLTNCIMAGIITHIAMSQTIKPGNYEYYFGSVLPDVHYVSKLKREQTHFDEQTKDPGEIDRVLSLFLPTASENIKAGFVFHLRSEHRWAKGVNIRSNSPLIGKAIKLWCDQIAWSLIESDLEKILSAFNRLKKERLFCNITQRYSERYIAIVNNYLSAKPSDQTRLNLATALGISHNSMNNINSLISSELINNKKDQRTIIENICAYNLS